MTSKITKQARERCAAHTPKEQIEDCRRAMQRESGADDMHTIDAHLAHDQSNLVGFQKIKSDWQTRCQQNMRIDGAD